MQSVQSVESSGSSLRWVDLEAFESRRAELSRAERYLSLAARSLVESSRADNVTSSLQDLAVACR